MSGHEATAMRVRRTSLRAVAAAYVALVGAAAAIGFVSSSPAPILLAALLTVPSSLVAMPAYYVIYGLLAQIPGANPDTNVGTATCTVDGVCHESVTGGLAPWFAVTTEVIGVLVLVAAAWMNVVVVRFLLARRATGRSPVR